MPIRKRLKKTSQEVVENADPLKDLSDAENDDKGKKQQKTQSSQNKNSRKRRNDSSDDDELKKLEQAESKKDEELPESEPFQLFISPKNSESQDQNPSIKTSGHVVNHAISNANFEQANAQVPSTPKSRLMITKMVLENFKSYAGIQNIGPFHKVNCS